MFKLSFANKIGLALSGGYALYVAVVLLSALAGYTRPFGLDFENLIVYTAPEFATIPWILYEGVNAQAVGLLGLAVGFFLVSRYVLGYLWGKIFTLFARLYLKILYILGTTAAVIFYCNFVVYNTTSAVEISKNATTVADCVAYRDSASGYMPFCIETVAVKNSNPDTCFELEKIGWSGFSDNCLDYYASAKHDPTICAKMGDTGNDKDTCYARFQQCENMRSSNDATGKDSCFIMRAGSARDKNVCAFVQNKTRVAECVCVSQYGYYGSECTQARKNIVY